MRKLLCLLLALAAFCTLAIVAAAEDTATVPTTCEACGGAKVEWVALTSSNKWDTLSEGHYHYYLANNDTTCRYTPNPNGTVGNTNSGAAVTICLDLNGYNITTDGRAVGVYSGCTLNVMDSSADQTGYIQGSTGNNNTVGGAMFCYGTLNLYGGTLRYVYDGVGDAQTYAGGALSLGSNYPDATFNMYGGRMEGGEMVVSSKGCHGGTIFAAKGNINLYSGDIISGKVQEGYDGPCIYLNGSVQMTLSGNANVDNIYIHNAAAKVNVSGTYSGKARITYGSSVTPSNGKVIGTATNTPKITGDLFCTNGDGWLVNVSGSNLQLATYTPTGDRHYCEHCKDVVKWTALTRSNYTTPSTTSGTYHYYLAQNQSVYLQVGNSSDKGIYSAVCLDLYGQNLTMDGRALLPWGGSTLNLMDTVGEGYVAGSAGNNNVHGGTVTVSSNSMFNMYGGTLKYTYSDASATTKGGTVNVNGSMNLYGGTIEGAQLVASTSGYAYGAAISVNKDTSVLGLYGGTVTSGILPEGGIAPCVYVTADSAVVLSGDASVEDIYFASNDKLFTVSGTYSGNASVTFASDVELGAEVGVSDNATITGQITCTNGNWLITPVDTALIVSLDAPVAVITESGNTGYKTLQAAIDACETGYIKLLRPITEDVTVSKDVYIDMNGCTITGTITVAEGKTLYGKDSQTDDYIVEGAKGYGKLTVAGNVAAQEGYLKINEDGKISFHRVTLKIHTMTLRPAEAGLYYKSTFLGDEKVAQEVLSFGVALSVQDTPNESNLETKCERSIFTGFESGASGNASTSTLLKGILKEDNSIIVNHRNMYIQVFGRPYIQTADGYIFGDTEYRSLSEQLQEVDTALSDLTGNQRNALLTMYETFRRDLSTINLPNIAEAKTQSDETLSILMVGNSFCYYYVEELYGLLMANPDPDRGYANVEIYNLYYSGCTLTQHLSWWQSGTAMYELYKTDENGRVRQTPTSGSAWTLEDALQQGRWDYISLQGKTSEVNYGVDDNATVCAAIAETAEPLLDRFHELHPYAQLLWHRTWAFEVGRISGGTIYTQELLDQYDAGMQAACDYMCNEFDQDKPYDLMMVNSGAAWPIAREANAKLETSLLPAGGLCARQGVANANTYVGAQNGEENVGDGYHDGDIGGGQFLNACVWYETLTGQSVLDNPYAPDTTNGKYTLSDALVELLRNAAHTALSN